MRQRAGSDNAAMYRDTGSSGSPSPDPDSSRTCGSARTLSNQSSPMHGPSKPPSPSGESRQNTPKSNGSNGRSRANSFGSPAWSPRAFADSASAVWNRRTSLFRDRSGTPTSNGNNGPDSPKWGRRLSSRRPSSSGNDAAVSAELEMKRLAGGGAPRPIISPEEQIARLSGGRRSSGLSPSSLSARRPSVFDKIKEMKDSSALTTLASSRDSVGSSLETLEGVEETKVKEWLSQGPTVTLSSQLPVLSVHPHGRRRLYWDLVSLVFIFYTAMAVPLQLAFALDDHNEMLIGFDAFVDIFFLLDVLLNFITGVEQRGAIVFDHRKIAELYLKFWFWVDLFAAVPWTLISLSDSDVEVPSYVKLARLARLLRIFRILRIIGRLEFTLLVRSNVSSIAKFFLVVVLSSHWFSCIFYGIGASVADSWIKEYKITELPLTEQYVAAYYWSIMTMTTVGFGDITANVTEERLFSILAMFLGAAIFAYGVTNIVGLIANLDQEEQKFRRKMDDINAYMEARELPLQLRAEIRQFFHDARRTKQQVALENEHVILEQLSALLRSKVAWAVNDHFLHKMPFFEGSDPTFVMDLALGMHMICYPPLEYVFRENDSGNEMFFIFRGGVLIFRRGKCRAVLRQNSYFGERGILEDGARRNVSVQTVCFTELRSLSSKTLLKALRRCPAMKDTIQQLSNMTSEPKTPVSATPEDGMSTKVDDDEGGGRYEDQSNGDLHKKARSVNRDSNGNLTTNSEPTNSFIAKLRENPDRWLGKTANHRGQISDDDRSDGEKKYETVQVIREATRKPPRRSSTGSNRKLTSTRSRRSPRNSFPGTLSPAAAVAAANAVQEKQEVTRNPLRPPALEPASSDDDEHENTEPRSAVSDGASSNGGDASSTQRAAEIKSRRRPSLSIDTGRHRESWNAQQQALAAAAEVGSPDSAAGATDIMRAIGALTTMVQKTQAQMGQIAESVAQLQANNQRSSNEGSAAAAAADDDYDDDDHDDDRRDVGSSNGPSPLTLP